MSRFPILRRADRILVQGITGTQGSFWTQKMLGIGSNVVGGVNPRRAGETHLNLPVFDTAKTAMRETGFDVAVMFIPPMLAKTAAIDAIESGAKGLVILTEHIPSHDVLEIFAASRAHNTRIVGPNTAGLVTPGETFAGIMPGHNTNIFKPGHIGVISRSGSLGTLICLNLTRAGHGQSSFVGIGGDPMIGTTSLDALRALDEDERTEAIVLVGEIGGAMEEAAAEYAAGMKKPVVSFIAGRAAPPDKRMGHAGAIVSGNAGSYPAKQAALERAGVAVADTPHEIVDLLRVRLAQPACNSS
ncbi:MAG: succinate--CoA ligase subunit alpha [Rhodospirillales bacterium]|nr:succinate--CoA ligase subunit alpha [Rhodospirillales bacterium]